MLSRRKSIATCKGNQGPALRRTGPLLKEPRSFLQCRPQALQSSSRGEYLPEEWKEFYCPLRQWPLFAVMGGANRGGKKKGAIAKHPIVSPSSQPVARMEAPEDMVVVHVNPVSELLLTIQGERNQKTWRGNKNAHAHIHENISKTEHG